MNTEVLCTIHSNNHVYFGKTIAKSFLRHHPNGHVFHLLADEKQKGLSYPDEEDKRITLLEAKDIGIPNFKAFAFKYNVTQFNCAVKPFFLERVISEFKVRRLIYLDPDIYIYRPLDKIFSLLKKNSLILIPHITQAIEDDLSPREVDIMKSGVYNLGFLGLSDTAESRSLLKWWADRLYHFCTSDVSNGYFHDQKWMDLAPSFCQRIHILREAGYDVAYWNLAQRSVRALKKGVSIAGKPLYFFHFSGIDIQDLNKISNHYRQVRVSLDKIPELKPLFEMYKNEILHNGYETYRNIPYAFNYFSNGARIHDIVRDIYRGDPNLQNEFPNPFEVSGSRSYYQWLRSDSPKKGVSNLAFKIMAAWDDLRIRYREVLEGDSAAFLSWVGAALKTIE